jgi:hypothetical protein
MQLINDDDSDEGRKNFRLKPEQKIHAFIFANLLYQELRPQFAKDEYAIKEIIHLLGTDPSCPVPGLSERTIRRFLADSRGRKTPGQWIFKRTTDPDTGREKVSVYENLGTRLQYPHPSNHRQSKQCSTES